MISRVRTTPQNSERDTSQARFEPVAQRSHCPVSTSASTRRGGPGSKKPAKAKSPQTRRAPPSTPPPALVSAAARPIRPPIACPRRTPPAPGRPETGRASAAVAGTVTKPCAPRGRDWTSGARWGLLAAFCSLHDFGPGTPAPACATGIGARPAIGDARASPVERHAHTPVVAPARDLPGIIVRARWEAGNRSDDDGVAFALGSALTRGTASLCHFSRGPQRRPANLAENAETLSERR